MDSRALIAVGAAVLFVRCGGTEPADDVRSRTPVAGAIDVPNTCTPTALLSLDAIPDDPTLDDGTPDTVAIFEVNGHQLIGKHVRDRTAAEGGLKLWQELTTRIPENQLLDLVQFNIYTRTDPIAIFNRRGDVQTKRNGLKLGFSTRQFELNDPDPCAPLVPRRGSFDWSLIHEFGHLRGWLDGSWDRFLDTFDDTSGPGEGYPTDGSPVLTGDFVTSYAERADGDEDHAESWTTFVMLPSLPDESANEPLALQKVRWISKQPALSALRRALRITEPGGGGVTVAPAPRRVPSDTSTGETITSVEFPPELRGTWTTGRPLGDQRVYSFYITADDLIEVQEDENGRETARRSLRSAVEEGIVTSFSILVRNGTYFIRGVTAEGRIDDTLAADEVNGRRILRFTREGSFDGVVLAEGPNGPFDSLVVPPWLQGTWKTPGTVSASRLAHQFEISVDDIVEVRLDAAGNETYRRSIKSYVDEADHFIIENLGDRGFGYNLGVEVEFNNDRVFEDFFRPEGDDQVVWARIGFGSNPLERVVR